MAPKGFTGVILAGGASRRMGTDKAALKTSNGEALLTVIKNRLQKAGAQKIVILGRPDEVGGIADKRPFAGPVQAIKDYLEGQTQGSQHLVVPVDMPGLTSQLLQSLALANSWANFEEQRMPFMAIACATTPSHITRIGGLLKHHKAVTLPIPRGQNQAFINLNHPQDFSEWRTKHQLPPDVAYLQQRAQHHV